MPKVKEGEKKQDFIKRCIPQVIEDGTAKDNEQAVAICNQMWEDKDKKASEKKEKYSTIVGRSFDVSYMQASLGKIPDNTQIEILQTGFVEHPVHGEFTITKGDLEQMVENFNNRVLPGVRITAGHEDDKHELPATAWIQELSIVETENNKFSLVGEVKWNKKGKAILENEEFKFFSPEFTLNHVDPENSEVEYGPTLLGGAHTNQPYFKGLEPIVASTKIINLLGKKDMATKKAKKTKEDVKKEDKITMSKKKFEALKAKADKADEGVESAKDLKKMSERLVKLQTKLKFKDNREDATKFIFSDKNKEAVFYGKKGLKDKLAHFMTSLSNAQRESFDEIMEMATVKTNKFSEIGSDGKRKASTKEIRSKTGYSVDPKSIELDERAKEIQASAKKAGEEISYGDAMVKAAQEFTK